MKTVSVIMMLALLIPVACNQTENKNTEDESFDAKLLQNRKEVALLYHQLDAENIDAILTEGFTGHGENGHTWNAADHRSYTSSETYKKDSIYRIVSEGDIVCTMFVREMDYMGERLKIPGMHFKKFEGEKISELWEYWDFDYRRLDEE
ncbi:MAG: hypothetical protein P1P82_16655 [Bacteroidales bacterium]|nr:hypothetical protein [Bacteroidales bacterium]MDT8430707.1 hypothetical protein [Bacteroidales bacterium]